MFKLVYTASDTFLGRAIRKITKSPVSHCMFQYYSELWGGDWVAQATFPTVSKTPAERSKHRVVHEFECLFDVKPGLHGIRNEFGKWYDFRLLFGLGILYFLWEIFKIKMRRPFGNTSGDLCSELFAKFYKASKLHGSKEIVPSKFTPLDSLRYNQAHPDLFRECTGK